MSLGQYSIDCDKMLWLVILGMFVVLPLILLIGFKGRDSQRPRRSSTLTLLYAPGSADIAAEAYHSPRKDSTMPFPLGKKKERKRTETFRRSSKD